MGTTSRTLILLLTLSLGLSTACTRSDSQSHVGAAKLKPGSAPQDEKNKKALKPLDISQLSPEERVAVETKAEDVVRLRLMMKTADHIFHQVWLKIWQNDWAPADNVFRLIEGALHSKYADNGLPFQNFKAENDTIVQEKTVKGKEGKAATNRRTTVQPQCKTGDFLFENIPGKENSYILYALTCAGGGGVRNKLAEIVGGLENKIVTYQIKFEKSNLQRYLGDGLMMLSSNPATCQMMPLEDGRLGKMDCSGLGQDYEQGVSYLEYTQLHFDRSKEKPLWGEAVKFKVGPRGGEKVEVIKVEDRPVNNEFVMDVIYREEKVKAEPLPKAAEPKKVLPTPVKNLTPEPSSHTPGLSLTTVGRQEAYVEAAPDSAKTTSALPQGRNIRRPLAPPAPKLSPEQVAPEADPSSESDEEAGTEESASNT